MKVTYLGHAAIMARVGWDADPDGSVAHRSDLPRHLVALSAARARRARSAAHRLPVRLARASATTSIRRRCAQLDKNVHVIIANYKRKRFRDRIAALGFQPHHRARLRRRLRLQRQRPDGAADRRPTGRGTTAPSCCATAGTTVLNVNDCHLDEATLARLGREHAIDLAFLTFTGASQYPGCFDFPLGSKIERALYSKHVAPRGVRQLGAAAAIPSAPCRRPATTRCWPRISCS